MIYNSPFSPQTSLSRLNNERVPPAVKQSTYFSYSNYGDQSHQYRISQNNTNYSFNTGVPVISDFKYEYPPSNLYTRRNYTNSNQNMPIITKSTFSADHCKPSYYYNRGELIDQNEQRRSHTNFFSVKSNNITPTSIRYNPQYASYSQPPSIQPLTSQQQQCYYQPPQNQPNQQNYQQSYYQHNHPPPPQPPPQQQQQHFHHYYTPPPQIDYKINYQQPEIIKQQSNSQLLHIQQHIEQKQQTQQNNVKQENGIIIKNIHTIKAQLNNNNEMSINPVIKKESEKENIKTTMNNVIDEKTLKEMKMKALAEIRPIKRNIENENIIDTEVKKKCLNANRENEDYASEKEREKEDNKNDLSKLYSTELQIHLSTSKFKEISQKYNNKPEYERIRKIVYDENIQEIIRNESNRHKYLPNSDSNTPSLRSLIYDLKKKLIERKSKVIAYKKKYNSMKKKLDYCRYELNELNNVIEEKEVKIVEFKSDIEEIEKMCEKLST